ncbi:MAG: STAS domain-containing protein [Streptosporangiaceae bacterium]
MGEHGTPGEPGGGLVLDDGTLRVTWRDREPPAMALAGEVDESSYPGLVAALSSAAAGRPEIHLDLAGLGYCDLAGLRAIVRLAGRDEAAGPAGARRVVLHRVPVPLLTVLHIVGWDEASGLTIAAD